MLVLFLQRPDNWIVGYIGQLYRLRRSLYEVKGRDKSRSSSFHRERCVSRSWDRSTVTGDIVVARARVRAFRQFVLITERLRGSASGASHLSATIVSALVHDYVSSTLFRFVIFVFRPIVACQLSPPRRSYYSTRHRLLLRSTRGVLQIRLYAAIRFFFFFEKRRSSIPKF